MDITSILLADECMQQIYSLQQLQQQEEEGLANCFQGDLLSGYQKITQLSQEQLEDIKRNLLRLLPDFQV